MITLHDVRVPSFAAVLALAAAVFFAYAASLNGDFVCDDRPVIAENVKIASAGHLADYFKSGLWDNTGIKTEDKFLYRPLLLVELFLSYRIWGANPFGFHLTNLLLHLVNSVLVFLLLKRFFRHAPPLVPLAGALVFSVHPVHVEAVSWIVGRNDLLLTLAVLGGFLSYLRYTERKDELFFAGALVLSFMAMLLKEVGLVFPLLIWGYDFTRSDRTSLSRKALFLAPVAAFLLLRAMALGGPAAPLSFSWTGLGHAVEFLSAYIKLLLLPWPLAFYFTRPDGGFIGLAGIVVILTSVAALVLWSRRRKEILFALGWVLVTLAPPLLVAFNQRPHIMERVLYLPSVGFSIIATGFIAWAFQRRGGWTASAVLACVLIFGVLTAQANKDWKNDQVFYTKAVKYNPGYAGAYAGLAMYQERGGETGKAIENYLLALRYATADEAASLNLRLGTIYGRAGAAERSMFYFKQVLAVSPGNSAALAGMGNNRWAAGNYREALALYLEAFSRDGKNYEACYNAAMAYQALGEPDKAIEYYRTFLSSAPVFEYADSLELARKDLSGLEKRYARRQPAGPGPAGR